MATDLSSPGSLVDWVHTLKEQIDEQLDSADGEVSHLELSESLRKDLVEAMELLLKQASEEPAGGQNAAEKEVASTEQIAEVLDASLAEWQTSVSNGFAQAVTNELKGQLKTAERLNLELREHEQRLARLQEECQEQQSTNLRQQTKLARQRRSVAKSLRARKTKTLLELQRQTALSNEARKQLETEIRAELDQKLAEQEQKAATLEEQLVEVREQSAKVAEKFEESNSGWQDLLTQANDRNEQLHAELRTAQEQLFEQRSSLETNQSQDSLHQELAGLQAELTAMEEQLAEERANHEAELTSAEERLREEQTNRSAEQSDESVLAELKEQLKLSQLEIEDLSGVQEKLNSAETELEELRRKWGEAEGGNGLGFDLDGALQQAQKTNDELREEIELLHAELNEAKHSQQADGGEGSDAPAKQAQQLTQALEEIEDLRSQNEDLASQLAKKQVASSGNTPNAQFDQESLSWEERKALIMQQLEDETPDSGQADDQHVQRRLEIEKVIKSTQSEVEKRDREIEELRSIVEQQSDTKQGVAIGAAAIAQMLDSDELIAQERQKLKEIQQEWEEKLRQAEIDLSMERAKLSRERTQLEAELENAQVLQDKPQEQQTEGKGKTRKWLEHLGLRDENAKNS